MEKYEPGDELSHVKLSHPLSLVGLTETSLNAEKHKLHMEAHPKGVLIEHAGVTYFVADAALVWTRKATSKAVALKPPAKK